LPAYAPWQNHSLKGVEQNCENYEKADNGDDSMHVSRCDFLDDEGW
jgi:hypothetical protein